MYIKALQGWPNWQINNRLVGGHNSYVVFTGSKGWEGWKEVLEFDLRDVFALLNRQLQSLT